MTANTSHGISLILYAIYTLVVDLDNMDISGHLIFVRLLTAL